MQIISLPVRFARKIPDPVFKGAHRHVFICDVLDLPAAMPKDPNPRAQRIDKGIWRDIRSHLLHQDGTYNTFHLKNKGITILAHRVAESASKKMPENTWNIYIRDGDGIVDGAHTYDLIMESQQEIIEANDNGRTPPIEQFIKVEVLTGIEQELAVEISGGLNTAVQVQRMSLENLRNSFDWIQKAIAREPYADRVAFRENEPGLVDVRDVLCYLYCFNAHAFPRGCDSHPVLAYLSKAKILEHYCDHEDQYKALRPILRDILVLSDIISRDGRKKHNDQNRGKGGRLAFVDGRSRGEHEFLFIGKKGPYRLSRGALLPMLAAFRWMVEIDEKTGKVHWKNSFAEVVEIWEAIGGEMMRATQRTSDENNRKVHAVGRSHGHWASLYNIVARTELERRERALLSEQSS